MRCSHNHGFTVVNNICVKAFEKFWLVMFVLSVSGFLGSQANSEICALEYEFI